MSPNKKKAAKKAANRGGGNLQNPTLRNDEYTTDNDERRSATPATPEGEPISSPATPTENDNKDRSTQRVLSMPLPTDQKSTTDQQSAAIIDLSQEREWYLSTNIHEPSSDNPELLTVLTQMQPLADEQMRLEKRAEQAQQIAQLRQQAEGQQQAHAQQLVQVQQQAEAQKQALAQQLTELKKQAQAERLELQAQLQQQAEARLQAQLAQDQQQTQAHQQAELRQQAETQKTSSSTTTSWTPTTSSSSRTSSTNEVIIR